MSLPRVRWCRLSNPQSSPHEVCKASHHDVANVERLWDLDSVSPKMVYLTWRYPYNVAHDTPLHEMLQTTQWACITDQTIHVPPFTKYLSENRPARLRVWSPRRCSTTHIVTAGEAQQQIHAPPMVWTSGHATAHTGVAVYAPAGFTLLHSTRTPPGMPQDPPAPRQLHRRATVLYTSTRK